MLYDEFQVGVVTCTEQEIDGEFSVKWCKSFEAEMDWYTVLQPNCILKTLVSNIVPVRGDAPETYYWLAASWPFISVPLSENIFLCHCIMFLIRLGLELIGRAWASSIFILLAVCLLTYT